MRQVRLFIAINFPDQVKRSLGAFMNELRALPSDAKWVEVENLHLTLLFLGNVLESQAPSITRALNRSVKGANNFCLNLGGVGVFPGPARPRVFWVGVSGDTAVLLWLYQRVQKEMGRLGFESGKSRFTPHLTLARLRSPIGFSAVMERAEKLAGERKILSSVEVKSVELMLSELGPRGPKYSVLTRAPLTGSS